MRVCTPVLVCDVTCADSHCIPVFSDRDMVKKVSKVTLPELTRVGKKYLAPLFDSTLTRCVTCVHPSKVEEVTADFKK